MATPYTLPEHLFTGDSRQPLLEGLQDGVAATCPGTRSPGAD